jgi:hypothetical protein
MRRNLLNFQWGDEEGLEGSSFFAQQLSDETRKGFMGAGYCADRSTISPKSAVCRRVGAEAGKTTDLKVGSQKRPHLLFSRAYFNKERSVLVTPS